MPDLTPDIGAFVSIEKNELQRIFDALKEEGYTLAGPTLGEGAIVYDEIEAVEDLPIGWTDVQGPGSYQLQRRNDNAYFGYVVGPQSWKKFLFPPQATLMTVRRQNGSFVVESHAEDAPRYALIGVRGCEMQALLVQDHVFLNGPYIDTHYKARREQTFVLAVNCTEPGETCFCASMGAGPKVGPGFDLALTELDDIFIVEVGSEVGRVMMRSVSWRPTGAFELQTKRAALAEAKKSMGRTLETSDLPNLLYQNLDHPFWREVGERCLSCANCTMVCPTCFCSDILEVSELGGATSERVRVWDSCFSVNYSHVHGGNIRPRTKSRYRQWLTHKFASWIDQFGESGCVGCGRCITWCPVGIDVTESIDAIREEV